ncbi:MAG TPA: peptidylprolyl isomerase [Oxalobacteraceae bacterium]|nr:peptidylprolyl isomerase [Oxalobacteraceae bacterium]
MGISVNGIDITDAAIERELPHHQAAANPLKQTVHELVLRTLLLQQAERLDIQGEDDDVRVERLLERELQVPHSDPAACERYYRNNPQMFSSGEMIEARHILFQVTPTAPLELLRETAEAILVELQARPDRFGELAAQYSNCSSGAVGGSLGQLSRGQTVPEFEQFAFRLEPGPVAERLLETRFGLHIVQVMRRIEGRLIPFNMVENSIADHLHRQAWQRALNQYLQILAGQADIEGITLEGAETPLVQ